MFMAAIRHTSNFTLVQRNTGDDTASPNDTANTKVKLLWIGANNRTSTGAILSPE